VPLVAPFIGIFKETWQGHKDRLGMASAQSSRLPVRRADEAFTAIPVALTAIAASLERFKQQR
jgi:hypothetical protein